VGLLRAVIILVVLHIVPMGVYIGTVYIWVVLHAVIMCVVFYVL